MGSDHVRIQSVIRTHVHFRSNSKSGTNTLNSLQSLKQQKQNCNRTFVTITETKNSNRLTLTSVGPVFLEAHDYVAAFEFLFSVLQ